jgi:hypothetical protein
MGDTVIPFPPARCTNAGTIRSAMLAAAGPERAAIWAGAVCGFIAYDVELEEILRGRVEFGICEKDANDALRRIGMKKLSSIEKIVKKTA